MKAHHSVGLVFLLLAAAVAVPLLTNGVGAQEAPAATTSKLAVVWTSGDPEVAHRMCLMYTHAAKTARWFDEVLLIVWGPSSRMLAADKDVEARVKKMMEDGVTVQACVACADSYGVSDDLRAMGIEVKPMGKPLSDLLQSDDWKVISF